MRFLVWLPRMLPEILVRDIVWYFSLNQIWHFGWTLVLKDKQLAKVWERCYKWPCGPQRKPDMCFLWTVWVFSYPGFPINIQFLVPASFCVLSVSFSRELEAVTCEVYSVWNLCRSSLQDFAPESLVSVRQTAQLLRVLFETFWGVKPVHM
jgi:hypothetical protein